METRGRGSFALSHTLFYLTLETTSRIYKLQTPIGLMFEGRIFKPKFHFRLTLQYKAVFNFKIEKCNDEYYI